MSRFQIHARPQRAHGYLVLIKRVAQGVLHDFLDARELPLPPKVCHHLEPHGPSGQCIKSGFVVDVASSQAVLVEAWVQVNLLSAECEVVLLYPPIALAKLAVGEYLLELLPRVDHVLRVIYVGKEAIDAGFELRLRLWQRPVELVIEEHQVHDPVVRDERLLEVGQEVNHTRETEGVLSRGRLGLDHLGGQEIQELHFLLWKSVTFKIYGFLNPTRLLE